MPAPILRTNIPSSLYTEFTREDPESALPAAPPSPSADDAMDVELSAARRRSARKAARVLGFDDMDMDVDGARYAPRSDPTGDRRRASLSHLNLASMSLREPKRDAGAPHQESMSDDEAPLLGAAPKTRSPKLRRGYKRLGKQLLRPFRLAKAPPGKARKAAAPTSPGSRSNPPTAIFTNPFDDEHAIEWRASGSGASPGANTDFEMSAPGEHGEAGAPPKTPRRVQYASAPTTPRTSPHSAKSRRSVASWQRATPRTPCSAKSWLSDGSPGSDFSPSSGGSVDMLRRVKKRRAREMASQQKVLQLLGPGAVGAVANATHVSETKLRYRDFSRQLQDRLRREL